VGGKIYEASNLLGILFETSLRTPVKHHPIAT